MCIIQEEKTGCGIAAVANIVSLSYQQVKDKANSLGIYANDEALYSNTTYVRRLLKEYSVQSSNKEIAFTSWQALPALALLATKFQKTADKNYWHWVVFVRTDNDEYVLDSNQFLKNPKRKDFWRMKPRWYILVFQK